MNTFNKAYFYYLVFMIGILATSCDQNYIPKPRGYVRIDFPEKEYKLYNGNCPYTFEYPVYSEISTEHMKLVEPCWFNIIFPGYDAKIHMSYKGINDNNFGKLLEDTRTLTYKHSIKADAINEELFINKDHNVYGILYRVKGNAASSAQFFLTDSTKHFVRGALYFNVEPNVDSLTPAINFFTKDIVHLMNTFQWK